MRPFILPLALSFALAEGRGVSDMQVRALVKALRSPERANRLNALEALRRLGPRAVEAVPALVLAQEDPSNKVALSARDTVCRMGAASIPPLVEFIRDCGQEEKYRWHAAEILAQLGLVALPSLLEAMDDDDIVVRMAAIDALPLVGPRSAEAIPKLTRYLAEPSVSDTAAVALARIAGLEGAPEKTPAFKALARAFEGGDRSLRRRVIPALELLGRTSSPAVDLLNKAVQDSDEEVRDQAAAVLNRLKSPKDMRLAEDDEADDEDDE